jgi:hypothetical protein
VLFMVFAICFFGARQFFINCFRQDVFDSFLLAKLKPGDG